MYETDSAGPPAGPGYQLPECGPHPGFPLYEGLIAGGIAVADTCGSIVDHLTARRLDMWLAARPQVPYFASEPGLEARLRIHARSAAYPNQPQAARLLKYRPHRGHRSQSDRPELRRRPRPDRPSRRLGPPLSAQSVRSDTRGQR
jgi:hypothetical protein